MNETAASAEVFLNPGDFHFGAETRRIHTLLGSCVAITLWHPVLRIGGMCHFMLPSRSRQEGGELDGRYGDEAVQMFLCEIDKFDTRPSEYQVKLFGGGNMFKDFSSSTVASVAQRNAEAGADLLRQNGFCVECEDVGGNGHRRVIFDLRDGNVWVKHEKN
ncbi:MAG: chemotaxis protein CheD [Sulfurimicrobium sp.]|nr:chemotaxis protein CheD [Sulfurimicrobium sp.]